MADTDLRFSRPPVDTPGPVELLFGEQLDPVWEVDATVSGSITGLSLEATASYFPDAVFDALVTSSITGLSLTADCTFDSNVERPICHESALHHQVATPASGSMDLRHQDGVPLPTYTGVRHQDALKLQVGLYPAHEDAIPLHTSEILIHQEGIRLSAIFGAQHQDGIRARQSYSPRHQQAAPLRTTSKSRHQDTYRDRRSAHFIRHQQAIRLPRGFYSGSGEGQDLSVVFGVRHQQAWVPRPGRWTRPTTPPPNPQPPCYTPSPHLLFRHPPGTPFLLFSCNFGGTDPGSPALVTIPVRRAYIVVNEISLRKVAGNVPLPCEALSMNLDIDSFTWTFTADLHRNSINHFPIGGGVTELEAMINGQAYRLLAENLRPRRSFGKKTLMVSGRGLAAELAAPHSPVLSFSDSIGMTANQLMEQALLDNGVPLPWAVDFDLTDWFVPANNWSFTGSRIEAISRIAAAAGGYVQPHATDRILRILPKYPVLPWNWSSATPDIEIPSSVSEVEDIEYADLPLYNRVFARGTRLVQVTIQGTAGDSVAPMVVDPLITNVDAGRQRGESILGNVGRKAYISLKLPVLPSTGIIHPGKLIRYHDGTDYYYGLSRKVAVSGPSDSLWQTITVESHV